MKKIAVRAKTGIRMVAPHSIVWIEANGHQACLYLLDNKQMDSNAPLKYYDDLLREKGFYRVHDHVLVNTEYIAGFGKGKDLSITLDCTTLLSGSCRKMPGFRRHMKNN